MLERLLNEIKNGNTTSPTVLAERLNLTPSMVNAMLETLEEQGYLTTLVTDCNNEKPCESCALSNLCSTQSGQGMRIRVINSSS